MGAARRKLRCQSSAQYSSLPARSLSGPAAAALPGQVGHTWVSGVEQPRRPPRQAPGPPPSSPRPPGPAPRQQVAAGAGRVRALRDAAAGQVGTERGPPLGAAVCRVRRERRRGRAASGAGGRVRSAGERARRSSTQVVMSSVCKKHFCFFVIIITFLACVALCSASFVKHLHV